MAEQQPEHLFIFAQGIFGAPPLNGQGDVPAHGIQELQVALVIRFCALIVLHHEHTDRLVRRLEWNAQPARRRGSDQLHFPFRRKPVKFALRNEHRDSLAKNVGSATVPNSLW